MPLTHDYDQPIADMTNDELRGKIARKAGHRPPKAQLTKPILNSVHAWFAGAFYRKPSRLSPGEPPRDAVLKSVVVQAINQLQDPGGDDALALHDYLDDVLDRPGTRPMNSAELEELIEAMTDVEDSRDWTDDEVADDGQ